MRLTPKFTKALMFMFVIDFILIALAVGCMITGSFVTFLTNDLFVASLAVFTTVVVLLMAILYRNHVEKKDIQND